jgi:hypothetical protein
MSACPSLSWPIILPPIILPQVSLQTHLHGDFSGGNFAL